MIPHCPWMEHFVWHFHQCVRLSNPPHHHAIWWFNTSMGYLCLRCRSPRWTPSCFENHARSLTLLFFIFYFFYCTGKKKAKQISQWNKFQVISNSEADQKILLFLTHIYICCWFKHIFCLPIFCISQTWHDIPQQPYPAGTGKWFIKISIKQLQMMLKGNTKVTQTPLLWHFCHPKRLFKKAANKATYVQSV